MKKISLILSLFIYLIGFSQIQINGSGEPISINTPGKTGIGLTRNEFVINHPDRTVGEFGSNGTYDGLGSSVRVSSTRLIHCFRQGFSHLDGGSVVLMDLNIQTKVWSNRRLIYPFVSGYDVRDPRIMIINDTLFVFFCTSDANDPDRPNTFAGFIKATDGLIGNNFSDTTAFPLQNNAIAPWGKGFTGYVAGEYFHPYWSATFDGPGKIFQIGLYHTTNNGATWSQRQIYSGTSLDATETQVVRCKDSIMVALARLEWYFGNKAGIGQSVSLDGGQTWSAMTRTNMGSTDVSVVAMWYHSHWDKIVCIYQDRLDGYLKISITRPAQIISNPLAWQKPVNYELNTGVIHKELGYPDIEPLNDKDFLIIWGFESGDDAWMRFKYDDFFLFN